MSGLRGVEQRRSDRRRVLKGAHIVMGGATVDCIIVDLSGMGARVRVPGPLDVPEQVTVRLRSGHEHPAQRRWVRGEDIGLEFVLAGAMARDAEHAVRMADPAPAMRLLRAAGYLGDEELKQAAEAAEEAHDRLLLTLARHAKVDFEN